LCFPLGETASRTKKVLLAARGRAANHRHSAVLPFRVAGTNAFRLGEVFWVCFSFAFFRFRLWDGPPPLVMDRLLAGTWMHPLRHCDVKGVDLSYAAPKVGSTEFGLFAARLGADALSDVLVRFGKRMREIREKVGVSQEKLAEQAHLHRTYVSSV